MTAEAVVTNRAERTANGVRASLHALAGLITDIALPPQCLACEAPVASAGALCPSCWSRFRLIEKPLCRRLGVPLDFDAGDDTLSPQAIADPPPFDRCRAVSVFDDVARRLIHRLKYGDQIELASWIGSWMVRAAGSLIDDADVIIPVPLHRSRLWGRRYNQAALLAKALAKQTGCSVDMHALRRNRATPQQIGLSASARSRNVSGAFQVPDFASRNCGRKARPAGRRCLYHGRDRQGGDRRSNQDRGVGGRRGGVRPGCPH